MMRKCPPLYRSRNKETNRHPAALGTSLNLASKNVGGIGAWRAAALTGGQEPISFGQTSSENQYVFTKIAPAEKI